MARNPNDQFYLRIRDWSGEFSNVQMNIRETDAANVDELLTVGVTDPSFAVIAAIDAITVGLIAERGFNHKRRLANGYPASAAARREKKWLISYYDEATFANYTMEIPTAIDTNNDWFKPNSDEADLTVTPWSDIVIPAFENGFIVSPDGGAITITSIIAVGRNL